VAARAGADVVHEPDAWLDSLRASGGADVVVDPVGGEVFDRSLRCLAPEGRLLTVGFASGIIPSAPANRLLLRNSSVVGFGLRELLAIDSTVFEATARRLDELVGNGLRPLVGEVYELEHAAQAFRAIEDRSAVGKTVLRVAPS
jgi:NADPH:quinone reductase